MNKRYVIAVRLGSEDATGYVTPDHHARDLDLDRSRARRFRSFSEASNYIANRPEQFATAEFRERCDVQIEVDEDAGAN